MADSRYEELHEVTLCGGPLDGRSRYAFDREEILLVLDDVHPHAPGKLHRYRRVGRDRFQYERQY
ncbi:MAG TPA: hypothetical protein VK081_09110 [Planctomycetota bacterium]|nr:hypothetical protein [Planctomycetota bacterium]